MYVTPIHIDPERPAMPISHPNTMRYLAKLHGHLRRWGWRGHLALSEGAIDERRFWTNLPIHRNERRFFEPEAVRTVRALRFDATRPNSHMFTGRTCAIEEVTVVGWLRANTKAIDDDTVLLVLSDHGFEFRRASTSTLAAQERFSRSSRPADAEYLAGVDWEKTKAYSFCLRPESPDPRNEPADLSFHGQKCPTTEA